MSALSIEMLEAAWNLPLGSTDKLVLLALADHVNQKDVNVCYPGIERLCERTGLTDRAIHKSLKRLKEAGHIEVIHRHRQANLFTLNLVPPTPNVVRVYPERSSLNPEPRSLRIFSESESEPEKNLRAEGVKNAGAEKASKTGLIPTVIHRKEPKHSEEFVLTARARVLAFRTKMGGESWAEYRAKMDRHEADNPVTASFLWDAVNKRRQANDDRDT